MERIYLKFVKYKVRKIVSVYMDCKCFFRMEIILFFLGYFISNG